jgi:hypothetical protein
MNAKRERGSFVWTTERGVPFLAHVSGVGRRL